MLGKGVMLLSLPFVLLGSVTIHSDICRMPTQPVVTAPAAGAELAEPTTTVKGTTTQYSTVTLKTNGRSLGDTTSDASGDFQMQVTLDRGDNHLTLQTSNPCGIGSIAAIDLSVAAAPDVTPPSSPTPTTPDTTPPTGTPATPGNTQPGALGTPELPAKDTPASPESKAPDGLTIRITSPAENFTTSDDSVFLTGVTNMKATQVIEVNNTERAHLTAPSKTFGVLVPLHMGKNTIKVTASANGQSAVARLHVIRVAATTRTTPWYEKYAWFIIPPALAATAFLTAILLRYRRRQ